MNRKSLMAAYLFLLMGGFVFYILLIEFHSELDFYLTANKKNVYVQNVEINITRTSDPIHAINGYQANSSLILLIDSKKKYVSEIFTGTQTDILSYKSNLNSINKKYVDIYLSEKYVNLFSLKLMFPWRGLISLLLPILILIIPSTLAVRYYFKQK